MRCFSFSISDFWSYIFFNKSSKFTVSLSIIADAFSIIFSSSPSFLLIAKALLFPGIPINNLYVGFKFSMSNSTLAFLKPGVTNAYFFNS